MILTMALLLGSFTERIVPSTGAPPKEVVSLDLRKGLDYSEKLLAASAQGLLNSREKGTTKIYLIWDDHDAFWLDHLVKNKIVNGVQQVQSLEELVGKARVRRGVIFDNKPYHLPNIATTLAGCERLLLVADPELASRIGIKIEVDLRNRFKTNREANDYLWSKYGSNISRRGVSITVPGPTQTHQPAQLRDYLMANKIWALWPSGTKERDAAGADPAGELEDARRILIDKYPDNIPCFGYPWSGDGYGLGEHEGVSFLSQTGKWLIPTDNFSNLSFWSTFEPSLQKPALKLRPKTYRKDTKYAALVMSDGDNLCTWRDYFPKYIASLGRRGYPVSWTMGPLMRELAPPLYDHAIRSLPEGDSIGSGVSGVGYVAPEEFGKALPDPKNVFRRYTDLTSATAQRSGHRWIWVMRFGPAGGPVLKDLAEGLTGIEAIMGGYGPVTDKGELAVTRYSNGIGAFHTMNKVVDEKQMLQEIDQILARPDCPQFLHFFLWNWGVTPDGLQKIAAHCAMRGVEIVTPEVLAQLYRDSESR